MLGYVIVFKVILITRYKESKNMSENMKTFLIKNIPSDRWRKFKIRLLENGYDTYNEGLLSIIESYAKKGK